MALLEERVASPYTEEKVHLAPRALSKMSGVYYPVHKKLTFYVNQETKEVPLK